MSLQPTPWSSTLAALSLSCCLSATAIAQDQTEDFDPLGVWSGDYRIELRQVSLGQDDLPTLQSFASATFENQWVLVAGRTNGLHNFSNSGIQNFPPQFQNSKVWVIDPATGDQWSRSLEDSSSGLSQNQVDSLSATNTQHLQVGDTLFVTGGYVFQESTNSFVTYNALTAIHLPDLMAWVKGDISTLPANTILQVPGEPTDNGGYFEVTGGELKTMNGRFYLIFGQNFTGPYTPGSDGVYTSQVRTFDIDYDRISGTLDYWNVSIEPDPGDPDQFRRRDMNIVDMVTNNGGTTDPEPFAVGLAGVFFSGEGVWTVPAEIGPDGVPVMKDPATDPDAFKQPMHHYNSATLELFSAADDSMTVFSFGGISANNYDATIGGAIYDGNYGFTSQISATVRHSDGTYRQYFSGSYPHVIDGDQNSLLFGAEAAFFAAPDLPIVLNGVLSKDDLTEPTVLGHIFGGIAADQPNNGNSVASNIVFEVRYVPIEVNSADYLLNDVRTVTYPDSQWFETVMGTLYFGDSPWFYSPSYGWIYSIDSNNPDNAWYYFATSQFQCWVYVISVEQSFNGFWAYALDGQEVDGWFYMNNLLNRKHPNTFYAYLNSRGSYQVFISP